MEKELKTLIYLLNTLLADGKNPTESNVSIIIRNIDEVVINTLQQNDKLEVASAETLLKLGRLREMYIGMELTK